MGNGQAVMMVQYFPKEFGCEKEKKVVEKGVQGGKRGFFLMWEKLKHLWRPLGGIQSRRMEKLVGTSPLGVWARGGLRRAKGSLCT